MIRGYAAFKAGEALQPYEFEPKPLGPLDVEIEISHCGICHSDIHLIDDDWGVSQYPLVPGHEIVGHVVDRGSGVELEKGARVGIGWQRGSCFHCADCAEGHENVCAQAQPTCVGAPGGFADRVRVDSRFAFPLPDGLESENAAPLLCAGVTVFSPILRHARPTDRVGIIGVGGLGHLAVQFAHAFGCETVAISHSPAKETEARKLGADEFMTGEQVAKQTRSFDFILSTVNADLNWSDYVEALRSNGKLCFVGVPKSAVSAPVFQLIAAQRAIVGSAIGGRPDMRRMLEFAAHHNIVAQTEHYPMGEVNAALDRVRSGQVRYRAVLVRE